MENRTKIIIFLTFCLIVLVALPAAAQTTARANVSLNIIAGDLKISATDISLSTINLSVGNTAVGKNVIQVVDPTGTKAGWNVTVKGSDFVSENGNRISLQDANFLLTSSQINTTYGGENQIRPMAQAQPIRITDGNSEIVVADRGKGAGKFQIVSDYEVTVPSNVAIGKYSSTLVYTITKAP